MASKLWRTYATRPVVVLDVEHLGSDPLKNPLPFAFGAVVLRLDAATGKLVIEPGSDRLWILTDPLEGTGTASDPKAVAFWRLPENRTMWTHLFRQRASHVGKPNDIPVIAVEHGVRTHVGHAADFCSDFLAYVEHVKCSSPDGKAAFASDSAADFAQVSRALYACGHRMLEHYADDDKHWTHTLNLVDAVIPTRACIEMLVGTKRYAELSEAFKPSVEHDHHPTHDARHLAEEFAYWFNAWTDAARETYAKEAAAYENDTDVDMKRLMWAYIHWTKTEPDFAGVCAAHEQLRANLFNADPAVLFEDLDETSTIPPPPQLHKDALAWLEHYFKTKSVDDEYRAFAPALCFFLESLRPPEPRTDASCDTSLATMSGPEIQTSE